jgi:tripartite-type tricarboxylate transporter receptor subunit TctC
MQQILPVTRATFLFRSPIRATAQMTPLRFAILLLLSTAAVGLSAAHAAAQDGYPQKSITILVGFAPGGSGDFVGRTVGQKLSEALRQPVVIENRGGANGMLAATAAASAAPNGYTLYVTSMGLTTNPHLYSKNRLDPTKTFTAISLIANVPNVLVTGTNVPGKDLRELLEYARTRTNPLTVATVGQGAPGHLISELLQRTAKVNGRPIVFREGASNDCVSACQTQRQMRKRSEVSSRTSFKSTTRPSSVRPSSNSVEIACNFTGGPR